MTFHEVRFPADISFGSEGGPVYSTEVITLASGGEQRISGWSAPLARYNVAQGVKTLMQLESLIAFFRARKGRAYGFRFKDWSDYKVAAQGIGTGNGSQTQFQLVKTYSSGGYTETQNIKKPVSGTVNVYLNGTLQSSGVSVNTATGVVTFSSAPGSGVVVTADYEFDIPVRFDTDRLSISLDNFGVGSWNEIMLTEIRVL